MKKINRKGYMLVEIIVSFALAFTVLIYLTNLLLKYKDINEDLFYSTKYIKDKNLITRNIMSDLENGYIIDVSKNGNIIDFDVELLKGNEIIFEKKRLEIDKENKKVRYGKINEVNGMFDKSNFSYYEKEIESSLMIGDIFFEEKEESARFQVPITSMYSDENYDLSFFVQINKGNIEKNFIIYNSNDETERIETRIKKAGDDYKIIDNVFINSSGKVFKECNTSADGTGESYIPGDFYTISENLTLYAIWKEEYVINYDANGGTGTMESVTLEKGNSYEIAANDFTAPLGKVFKEWNTSVDGTGESYILGDLYTITENLTLYAIWIDIVDDEN